MEQLFCKAVGEWRRMESFRADRARCKRYVYGDQWEDVINLGTHSITEREFIIQQGQIPLKNNILRRVLRNVLGLYRAQYKVPQLSHKDSGLKGEALRVANSRRRQWFKKNSMEELAPRLLEEFLISGLVAVRVDGEHILPITPDNFFFHSDGYDPRGNDVDMVGEVHCISFDAMLDTFCKTAEDYRRITELYKEGRRRDGKYTITEVWHKDTHVFGLVHDEQDASLRIGPIEDMLSESQKESSPGTGRKRMKTLVRRGWRQRWFAHDGTLLRESEVKATHPYIFKAYPFIDGEVHSYISDIIDQQRYVNRLITLYDFVMKSSAKGVLLFPEDSIPAGMDLQDVAEEWSRFNGVIPYRARPGMPMPTQVSGNAGNIGITELLKIELQMLEDISGVSPTLQGKLVTNSTSGTLFAQQNEAAQTALLDVIRTFTDFITKIAESCLNDTQ